MSLPKPAQPVFSVEIEELGKVIKYRPFLMKEERAILMAKAIGDDDSVRDTIEQVVQDCIVEGKNPIKVDDLPAHIVDYLFMQMFTKSNTDRLPVTFTCTNLITKEEEVDSVDEDGNDIKETIERETECGHESKNHLDLKQITIDYPENYKERKAIKVSDKITLNIDYPKSSSMRNYYKTNEIDEDGNFVYSQEERERANELLIFESVVNITEIDADGNERISLPEKDFDVKEFISWIDELPKEVSISLAKFFQEMPQIKLKATMHCLNSECLHKTEYTLTGAKAFLDLS